MVYHAKDLVELAKSQIGYHEKASNAELFDNYANAGSGNWNKYAFILARAGYYNGDKQSQPYCDIFCDACFYMLCNQNKTVAEWLECQTGDLGAACKYSAQYYQQQGRFDKNPKIGDQIFFYYDGDINHTGIVTAVVGSRVYTVEGNVQDQVMEMSYDIYDSHIAGYGHPRYEEEYTGNSYSSSSNSYSVPTSDGELQIEDGYPVLRYGDKGVWVRNLQTALLAIGYSVGASGADGEFGYGTKSAILQLQNKYGLTVDGIVGKNTWEIIQKLYYAKQNGEVVNYDPTSAPTPIILGEEDIWYALSKEGFNDYAVAGIMGNMVAESGLRSNNLQDTYEGRLGYTDVSYTEAIDNGIYHNFDTDYAGYGICQWTLGSRKRKLLDYARANAVSIGDTQMQISFFVKELKEDFYRVYTTLINASSVQEASNIMLTDFERPEGYNTVKLQAYRASLGQEFYDKFKGSGLVTDNPNGYPTVSLGSHGSYVKDLQEKLIKLGYSVGDDGADGEFGENTKLAVERFQSDYGIYADGVCGSNTWKSINNAIDNMENSSSGKPELQLGSEGKYVKELQKMLNALGYKCPEDGKFGRQLLAAIMRFQSVSSLFCSGIVNDATWSVIQLAYNKIKDKIKEDDE